MFNQSACDQPMFDAAFRDRLAALFRWRRDVRTFRRDPLPAGMIESLIDAACLAPSVGLSQPWRFVRVDDAARRAAVRAVFAASNAEAAAGYDDAAAAEYRRLKLAGLDEAPVQLAAFVQPAPEQGRGLGRQTMPEMTAYSVVAAVQNLWLAAAAAGIGVGWVSILDPPAVTAALDVPTDWRLIAYLCIGYPAGLSDTPLLEQAGWEQRQPPVVIQR